MKWKYGLGAVAVAAAVAGLVFGVTTFTRSANAQGPGNGDPARFQQLLAQNLGISVDQLQQAETKARNQMLDEAVTAGKLTQAQADKLKSQPIGAMFGLRGAAGQAVRRGIGSVVNEAATTIGIDQQSLSGELMQGKSIAQVAAEHNISRDTLKQGILSVEKANLQQAVGQGKLTQTQADTLLQGLTNNIDRLIDATHQPKQPGQNRPMMRGFRNQGQTPTPNQQ